MVGRGRQGQDGDIYFSPHRHGDNGTFGASEKLTATCAMGGRRPPPGQAESPFENGSTRMRFLVAAWTALARAGPMGGTPGSPMPVGAASVAMV